MKRAKIFLASLLLLISFTTTMLPATVLATKSCSNSSNSFLGLPTWYKYLTVVSDGSGGCDIKLPADSKDAGKVDFGQAVGRIGLAVIEVLLRVGAMVAVGFIIYGGFRYILSQGEPDAIKKAQGTIINSVIGLVITIFATAIVNLVGGILF